MMMRPHGQTFLTRPRWFTRDRARAAASPFQWAPNPRYARRHTLSLLGVINGILPRLPGALVLVCVMDADTRRILTYKLRRRWWS